MDRLDKRYSEVYPTEVPVKSVFKERFDTPELVTDDVDENERELKFILLSFQIRKSWSRLSRTSKWILIRQQL